MKKYLFVFLIVASSVLGLNADDFEQHLVFHFNFENAASKREIKDMTGKFRCISENNTFVVQRGALRTAPVARIYIPCEKLPDISEKLTVSAWILKRSTPDATPILMKGQYPEPVEFLFSVGWRYPVFCYKNQPKQNFWKGVYYRGDFGTRIYYGEKDFLVAKDNLIESSGYWRNVTATFDRGEVKIYVDGSLTAETKSPQQEKLKKNNMPIYIGASRLANEDLNFKTSDMLINDIRLYNEVLSPEAVKKLFEDDSKNYDLTCLIPQGETHLNALAPCRDYPFDPDYDPEFKRKLRITVEYEKKLGAGKIKHEKINSVKVINKAGEPELSINGAAQFPMQILPAFFTHADGQTYWDLARECVKDFAAAGINLVGLTGMDKIWVDENKYDWRYLDDLLKIVIEANPAAMIMPYLSLSRPPKWFAERYPEEMEKLYRGSDLRTQPTAPLGSRIWLKHSIKMLHDLVSYLENGPYAPHIYSYKIGGGESAEWYWPGGAIGGLALSGYSEATLGTFREWLRKRYSNDPHKLRKAWNNPRINFDTAVVPGVNERRKTENYYFRDPLEAAAVIDFKRYMSDMTFEHIEAAAKKVKEACEYKKTVVIYGGYQLNSNTMKLANNGRLANERVFSCPYIDMLTTPIGYRHRRGGETGLNVNPFDASARLHNKFIWRENDLRTHFCEVIQSSRTATMEETINVIQRSFGHALISGGGIWFYPFHNAWFHQNEVMESINQMRIVSEHSLKAGRRSVAEVAFLFDEESLYYLAYDCGNFMTALGKGTHLNAARMGAPYDIYMLSDIKNPQMPDYKMYIFMNAFRVDNTTRDAIARKVRKNNAVSVWCYAPGYITDKGFDIESSDNLSGISLQETRKKQHGKLCITEHDHPITGLAGEFENFTVSPFFHVTDPAAKILGTFNGKPALALKEFANWRSVYSLVPLTRELLTGLCDYAGVHVYSRSFDVLRANNNYIMIHTTTPGTKTISLPRKSNVTEILTEKLIGKELIKFSEELPAQKTRIYQLNAQKDSSSNF